MSMNRSVLPLLLACVSLGLFSGCDKEEVVVVEDPAILEDPIVEDPVAEEPVVEEPVVEEDPALEGDAVEGEGLDEALFNKAYYEATCVQSQIEDPERQNAILDEIYARYGFEADSYKTAREQMAEAEHVKMALKTRMEKCTKEVAETFEKAGAVEEGAAVAEEETTEEKTEDNKPKAPVMAYKAGNYSDRGINFANIKNATVLIKAGKDGSFTGSFEGRRDKAFDIPFRGKIGKDGKFTANGRTRFNSVSVQGQATKDAAVGTVSGTIDNQKYKIRFTAKN